MRHVPKRRNRIDATGSGLRLPRVVAPTNRLNRSNGFPSVQRVVLTFESQHTLNPGAAVAQYTFRGNSLYDPDYTGVGLQPRYYGKYRVFGSRITIDIIKWKSLAAVSWPQMAVLPRTDVVTSEARVITMVPIASRVSKRLLHTGKTSLVCGLRSRQVMDEDWGASVGSNPLQIWYWNVCVASVDNETNVAVSLRVRIEFDREFYDRIDPGLSVVVVEGPEINNPTSLGCPSYPRCMGCKVRIRHTQCTIKLYQC